MGGLAAGEGSRGSFMAIGENGGGEWNGCSRAHAQEIVAAHFSRAKYSSSPSSTMSTRPPDCSTMDCIASVKDPASSQGVNNSGDTQVIRWHHGGKGEGG